MITATVANLSKAGMILIPQHRFKTRNGSPALIAIALSFVKWFIIDTQQANEWNTM